MGSVWCYGASVFQIETAMLKDFISEVCFYINWLSSNITHVVLINWPLKDTIFIYYVIDYFLCSFHVVVYSKNINQSIQTLFGE